MQTGDKVIIYPNTNIERFGVIDNIRDCKGITEYTIIEDGKEHYFYRFELKDLRS